MEKACLGEGRRESPFGECIEQGTVAWNARVISWKWIEIRATSTGIVKKGERRMECWGLRRERDLCWIEEFLCLGLGVMGTETSEGFNNVKHMWVGPPVDPWWDQGGHIYQWTKGPHRRFNLLVIQSGWFWGRWKVMVGHCDDGQPGWWFWGHWLREIVNLNLMKLLSGAHVLKIAAVKNKTLFIVWISIDFISIGAVWLKCDNEYV